MNVYVAPKHVLQERGITLDLGFSAFYAPEVPAALRLCPPHLACLCTVVSTGTCPTILGINLPAAVYVSV